MFSIIIVRRRLTHSLIRQFHNQIIQRSFTNNVHNLHQTLRLGSINAQHNLQLYRHKSKKSKKQGAQAEVTESETEESTWDDQVTDKNTKVMQVVVRSMRIDGLLKSGLGIARNKIETFFYDSKIRVNGKKLLKKSELAAEGDEIDVVKCVSPTNPDFLIVARIEILGVTEKGENIAVKIRKCKSLTIENYEGNVKPSE